MKERGEEKKERSRRLVISEQKNECYNEEVFEWKEKATGDGNKWRTRRALSASLTLILL